MTVKSFKPMTTYLSEKPGQKVKVVAAKNFPTFWKNVNQKKYDIVRGNQLHDIVSHENYAYQFIASNI